MIFANYDKFIVFRGFFFSYTQANNGSWFKILRWNFQEISCYQRLVKLLKSKNPNDD